MRTKERAQILRLVLSRPHTQRRALYTCLAKLHRWPVHPSSLFPPMVHPKAGPSTRTTHLPRLFPPPPRNIKKAPRRSWKLPWQKEQVLTGERVIALNHPDANAEFLSNYVSTAKYNTATFVPKFFFGQCPGSWRTSRLPTVLTHSSAFRAILEIRQSILPFHRLYSTNSWCLAHQQVDHHRTTCHRPPGFRLQRGPRRSRPSPILSTLGVLSYFLCIETTSI
jgi:hypothetical protein